jgi:TIR domain
MATHLRVRSKIFISYSHKDKKWLERLQTTFEILSREKQFSFWDDTQIRPGEEWREKIGEALATARLAVLLVSNDFLNSRFIREKELPPLLDAAGKDGLRILWVAVRHSLYSETEIERYQAVNDPKRPLESLRGSDRDKELVRISKEILKAVSEPDDLAEEESLGPDPNRAPMMDTTPAQAPQTASDGGVRVLGGDTARIELTLHRDFATFTPDEQERFLSAFKQLLTLTGDVRVTSLRPGSVKLTVELPADEAERLLAAARAGALAELGVGQADLVGTFISHARKFFESVTLQVEALARYMRFSDGLHSLEFTLRRLELSAVRLPKDETAWEALEAESIDVREGLVDLQKIGSSVPTPKTELPALGGMESAVRLFEESLERRDVTRLQSAVRRLRELRDAQSGWLDRRLITVAKDLGLPALINSLSLLRFCLSKLREEGDRDEDLVRSIEAAVNALSGLNERFESLVSEHDRLARVFEELKTIGRITGRPEDLRFSLDYLFFELEALPDEPRLLAAVRSEAEKLETAVSDFERPEKIQYHLAHLNSLVGQAFFDTQRKIYGILSEIGLIVAKGETQVRALGGLLDAEASPGQN